MLIQLVEGIAATDIDNKIYDMSTNRHGSIDLYCKVGLIVSHEKDIEI